MVFSGELLGGVNLTIISVLLIGLSFGLVIGICLKFICSGNPMAKSNFRSSSNFTESDFGFSEYGPQLVYSSMRL